MCLKVKLYTIFETYIIHRSCSFRNHPKTNKIVATKIPPTIRIVRVTLSQGGMLNFRPKAKKRGMEKINTIQAAKDIDSIKIFSCAKKGNYYFSIYPNNDLFRF